MTTNTTSEPRRFEQAVRTRARNQCRICNRDESEVDELHLYKIIPKIEKLQMGNYVLLCDEHYQEAHHSEGLGV